MGCMPRMFSSSSHDTAIPDTGGPDPPIPDPNNFKIIKEQVVKGFTILMVNYPGCTTFEGNKILVFESLNYISICATGKLDPHFCEDLRLSPIARFEPTKRGWNMALRFAEEY